jgi:APA family basic amino acid/polyamine antiporter
MSSQARLTRELGVLGAVFMGLGSIVGTGVFVSIGIAAGVAGPAVILAIMVGAAVASANGISSAQLAANHPVSGGTYEYGYRYLNPVLGFIAGWSFLLAKSASAATAALGFAGYVLVAFGIQNTAVSVPLALAAVILLTVLVLTGIRRSNTANIVIVSITLLTLLIFVVAGLPATLANMGTTLTPFFEPGPQSTRPFIPSFLYASALMFVAYTGYGRIATLGEEVREPRTTIPRAIITTLVFTMLLYASVGFVAAGSAGVDVLSSAVEGRAAPLEIVARALELPLVPQLLAVGAVTAMLGVLLNLILGLSRVLLAMGRRRDAPAFLGELNEAGTTPTAAVAVMGLVVAGLVLIGDVRTTWSFSAFTVLIYYSLTNLAALQLTDEERLFPRWISVAGLLACLFLAFWVEIQIWLIGLGILALGVVWHLIAVRLRTS